MNVRVLLVHRFGSLLCVLVSAAMAAGPAAAVAQLPPTRPAGTAQPSGRIDVTYVGPEAVAVVVIRPAQILSARFAEMLPVELASAAGVKYLGLDLANVDEIIAAIEIPTIPESDAAPADDAGLARGAAPARGMPTREQDTRREADPFFGGARAEPGMSGMNMMPGMGMPGIGMPGMAMPEFNYVVTVKFIQPFRGSDIPENLRAHTQLGELAGRRYLQSPQPDDVTAPSFYAPDNRTLVIAPDATLRRLVATRSQRQRGRLLNRVRNAPAGNDLFVAVDVARLRPQMASAAAGAEAPAGAEAAAEPLTQASDLITVAELTINLSGAGSSSLVVYAKDLSSGAKFALLIQDALTKYQQRIQADFAEEAASQDPVEQALAHYMQRVAARWAETVRPERDGATVTLFHADRSDTQFVDLAAMGTAMAYAKLKGPIGQLAAMFDNGAMGGAPFGPTVPIEVGGARTTMPVESQGTAPDDFFGPPTRRGTRGGPDEDVPRDREGNPIPGGRGGASEQQSELDWFFEQPTGGRDGNPTDR